VPASGDDRRDRLDAERSEGAQGLVQNVLHEVAHDLRHLIFVFLFELVDVVANGVVEHREHHPPAAFDYARVLVY